MKKIFAAFCAIVLMPTFSAHAWIGGPFSNNTYFGEDGDDGVYEAVGIPRIKRDEDGLKLNGIGLYRWGVTNNFPGLDPQNTTTLTYTSNFGSSTFIIPVSGNVEFGGVSQVTHNWYINGVYYIGLCQGTVNSGLGFISCIGAARAATGLSGNDESVSSSFRARFSDTKDGIPVRRFEGGGAASLTNTTGTFTFPITVFGSKVSNGVQYFGLP